MPNNILDKNIFFETDYINLLKKQINAFSNQAIQIITSPKYVNQAENLYNSLKKIFKISISYVASNLCYSLAGVNTLWCSQRENVRLIVAVGDEHIHNITKLLSQKTQLPYCFLSFDFASIYSLKEQGILFSGNLNQPASNCLFKNYCLSDIDMNTCACVISQAFSLVLLPFENYLCAKLENKSIDAKANFAILNEIKRLMLISKNLALGSLKAKFDATECILKLSALISQADFENEIFLIAQKYVFQEQLEVDYLPIYSFITFQVLTKVLKQFFDAELVSPLSITFANVLKSQYNKDNIKKILQESINIEAKLQYVYYANQNFLEQWLAKMNTLETAFCNVVKDIFPDCGYSAFSQIDYSNFLAFLKINLINNPSVFMSKINLVAII